MCVWDFRRIQTRTRVLHATFLWSRLAAGCLGALLAVSCLAQTKTPDWQTRIREQIAQHNLSAALQTADARLAQAPRDLEAHGWRARLLAWTGRWREAESEYRFVLAAAPHDVDILVGLAQLLSWQGRHAEALRLLDQAEELAPTRADVDIALGRVFHAKGDLKSARLAFQKALALEPGNQDAAAGLASLISDARFTLSVAAERDTFNFTSPALGVTTTLAAQISSRWVATISGIGQSYFGSNAGTFSSSLGYKPTRHDSLTVGGGFANQQAVVPTSNFFFEYGHGFRLSEGGFFRGIETSYHQQWFWYQGVRVVTVTPRLAVDLRQPWSWSLQVTAAKTLFAGVSGGGWYPSGISQLNFPLVRSLSGNVFYAVGTEDYALVDQIGKFSAHTTGGGLSYWLRHRHQFSGYIAQQSRSQSRTMTIYGVAYAVRF